MDLDERIFELGQYGYTCGQILMQLLLDTVGEENPDLVRCAHGFAGGVGYSWGVCGCMAAGCAMISYFTGKAGDHESESSHHKAALEEFTQWFVAALEAEYGSADCSEIFGGDSMKKLQNCPPIMALTYEKTMEILENRGLI